MLSKKMAETLNEQINKEMYSAYLYMSMSAHSENIGLSGFANWFMVQYKEEMSHAMKIYNYLLDQGSKVSLKAIDGPPNEFKAPMEMFEKTLAHEQLVTQSINNIVNLAVEEKDHATHIFLQWFVSEQVEEESNDNEIIGKLRLINDNPGGLFMLDKDLSARVFIDETLTA